MLPEDEGEKEQGALHTHMSGDSHDRLETRIPAA
jgi:hypothetical protein